jgi:hypothetical protein
MRQISGAGLLEQLLAEFDRQLRTLSLHLHLGYAPLQEQQLSTRRR